MSQLDLQLDSAHDLALVGEDLALTSGASATAQAIKQRLLLWLGEWFLDTTAGVPYLEQIFVKGTKLSVIRSILLKQVASTVGVTAVTRFDLFPASSRGLDVVFSARVGDGEAVTSEVQLGV